MVRVVIAGGGWAGSAAALAAVKAGASVTLLERTDMLLGTGLVGGIMRNNGRWTAAEEMIALGGGELFDLADQLAKHRNIDFPGHKHATFYDVALMEPNVRRFLIRSGVELRMFSRACDVKLSGDKLLALKLDDGSEIPGDVFVEATGTAGGMVNCRKYGKGCVLCILRCPHFGPRISIAAKAGVQEFIGRKEDGSFGAMSGSCKLLKDSLDRTVVDKLEKDGLVIIPIPGVPQKKASLEEKACQQYSLDEYAANVIILDTGHAKLMAPYYPLAELRNIPGLSNARYEDPYCAGIGNSIRYMAMSPRDDYMRVKGLENLFCAGEKAGPLVGHTEAIVTGTLAGYNAARSGLSEKMIQLPRTLMVGESIAWVNEQMSSPDGIGKKYTFSGSVLFAHLEERGYYLMDRKAIADRVKESGYAGIFAHSAKT